MSNLHPVIRIIGLKQNYVVLEVIAPCIASSALPGQFCQLLPMNAASPMLRIPISIYEVEGNIVRFMIKVIGQGTTLLSQTRDGEMIDIMGPLGNSFQFEHVKDIVMVSGGVGYPPLAFLKSRLGTIHSHWFHGGYCSDDTFPCDEIYTEDGSVGQQGYVTTGLKEYLSQHTTDMICACGPRPMLAACVAIAKEYRVPIQVSMEAYMACGIGVCYGCVVPIMQKEITDPKYKRVCKDGPIFNGYEVNWDE